MPTQTFLINASRPAGVYPFGPVTVPQGLSYVTIGLDLTAVSDRTPANAAKTLGLTVWMSLTGADPYDVPIFQNMTFQGGVRPANGTPPFECTYGTRLPSPELATRKIKGELVLSDTVQFSGRITTEVLP